jgi:lysophospholipase L1-like esterase
MLFLFQNAFSQVRHYSTFYYQRATLFESLPVSSKDIVFLGNSITNGGEWSELFNDKHIKNRGISGDMAMGVYDRLDPILKGKPAKIFLLIGINDLARGTSVDSIVMKIGLIVQKIKKDSPGTKLYIQSVLPVTDQYKMFGSHTSRASDIPVLNEMLNKLSENEKVIYVDLYTHFADNETGKMKSEYTNDGLHLLGNGYLLWRDIILPYLKRK